METSNKTTFSNIGYLFLLQGLNFIIPLVILPYLLKTLGPDKFGTVSFGQAVAQYFILIVDFGFNLSAVKRVAVNRDNVTELSKIFWSTMYAKLALCIFCFLANLVLIYSVHKFYAMRDVINIFFFMVIGFAIFPVWFFQGIEKIKLITIINLAIRILILPLTFILVKKPSDYYISAFIQSAAIVISGIISLLLIYRYYPLKMFGVNLKEIWKEVKESWPIFLSNIATSIYTSSFIIILGFFATTTQIGYYTTADRITRAAAALVLLPISQALYPKISFLVSKDVPKAVNLLKKTVRVSFIILFTASLAILLLSGVIIKFLGADYANALPLLKLMSFTPLLIGLGGVYGQLGLLAFGDKKGFRNVFLLCGSISLVLVICFTAFLKEYGTALSLIITEFLVLLFMYSKAKKYLRLKMPAAIPANS